MTIHMNSYDITEAIFRFGLCAPNRAHVARVVRNLAAWADENSDGWAYWPAPKRAAQLAMDEIVSRTTMENVAQEQRDLTDAQVRRVLGPIKAFCTRQETLSRMSRIERNRILNG